MIIQVIGVDPRFGSSNTAIVCLVSMDDKLVVTYSKEFEDADYSKMIAITANLMETD